MVQTKNTLLRTIHVFLVGVPWVYIVLLSLTLTFVKVNTVVSVFLKDGLVPCGSGLQISLSHFPQFLAQYCPPWEFRMEFFSLMSVRLGIGAILTIIINSSGKNEETTPTV